MATHKQQFNIYLAPSLIAATKHRAIDEQISLSDLVSRVLHAYLSSPPAEEVEETKMPVKDTLPEHDAAAVPALKLQPMIHVEEMAASIRFYEALGGRVLVRSRDDDWAQIALGDGEIGLLAHPANPEQSSDRVELNFTAEEPLAAVEERLRLAGVTIVRGAADEAFGEQLQVETPDGLLVKINRLEPETFA
jgi:catechol 2,3-dioxygenase-like lactoylglutathione lyase family enzyme